MNHPSMQAFAMGRELAFFVGKASLRGEIALAVLPEKTPLAMLLDAALVVIVVGIIRAALAVQLAFQAAFRARIGLEFLAEGQQLCLHLTWHNGDGGGTQIKPDHVRSHGVLLLLVRFAFQDELRVVAVALRVCSLRVRAGCLAPDKTRILDGMPESMTHDRIIPVDQCREAVFAPNQPALVALCWLLKYET